MLPDCLTAACRTGADNILGIAKSFWDLVSLRRDQKLLPHFGEAGTSLESQMIPMIQHVFGQTLR